MNKYFAIFKIEFIHFLEYRSEFIAELISIFVQLFISAFFALAFFENTNDVYGYSISTYITYVVLTAVVSKLVNTDIGWVLAEQIKNGDLSNLLVKPLQFNWYRLFAELSWKSHSLFYSLIAIGVTSIVLLKQFTFHIILTRIPIFLIAILMSYFLNRAFRYIVGCLAFWTKDTGGITNFINEVLSILGGKWFPLEFYGPLFAIVKLLPFSYIYYFPVQLLINRSLEMNAIGRILLIELLWTILFTVIGQFIWRKGIKHFESVGI